ncbi:Polygalacturonase (Pectinase) [uncultured Paludibacter sp.]|uniref:Polygalacturonase (Pectinase) n=1 Tax=uncultured Paludibacter sp. TaxID=497635 RepID=A0A653AJX0_9BACT|nr:Polygalacturonase (Pectinase) [uncultured Paludibacter sp.]
MKILKQLTFTLLFLLFVNNIFSSDNYKTITVDAPFKMELIKEFIYPKKDFPINKFGAKSGGVFLNTKAIAKAIDACNKKGGGRVVVPAGIWLTGQIHLKSDVNLYLEEGAVLSFTDNPDDYLPAVMTSWEGLECYNYSPLVYAYQCENVAITGKGTLQPKMDFWKTWFARPQAHLDASKELYTKASTNVPVIERQMAVGENHFRPHLIQFNRCKNVLLDGFKIRESPFWTIHIYMCDNGIARNLDVRAHGHNNDGIDLEMTRNFLVENCIFDQGDDAVVIKAGRNQDAWRLNTPTENVVIRNCEIIKGHALMAVGSEMSSGIRNIYMTDCKATSNVLNMFYIKTNHRRGGFIENIYMNNVECASTGSVLGIDTDVLYQWKDLVPTYETRITKIRGIYLTNVKCDVADNVYDLKGDIRQPISDIEIKNVYVKKIKKYYNKVLNVLNLKEENVKYDEYVEGQK